jgi:hypothetical protein
VADQGDDDSHEEADQAAREPIEDGLNESHPSGERTGCFSPISPPIPVPKTACL